MPIRIGTKQTDCLDFSFLCQDYSLKRKISCFDFAYKGLICLYLVNLDGIPHSRSFLEREDFESELGSVDPFAEDFSEIAKHDIVELVADGDRVARSEIEKLNCW